MILRALRRGESIFYGWFFWSCIKTGLRPKFDKDILKMEGQLGIGCISDYEPQPLIVRSHLGTYAITTVGKINNSEELMWKLFNGTHSHFLEMSGGDINPTELTAALINQQDSFVEGIRYAQNLIRGSMTMMVMTSEGIYAARDRLGRTPVEIGAKEDAHCICFESFSFLNLGYHHVKELGPGEIVLLDRQDRVLFSGDGILEHLWLQLPESLSVAAQIESMKRLLPLRDSFDVILHGHCRQPAGIELFDTLLSALEDLAKGNTADDIDYAWFGQVSKAHPYQPNDRRIVYKDSIDA